MASRQSFWSNLVVSLLLCAIAVVMLLLSCSGGNTGKYMAKIKYPVTPGKDELALAEGMNSFAFRYYQTIVADPGSKIFSPFGLNLVLSMLYAGTDGKTKAELGKCLGFASDPGIHHPAIARLQKRIWDAVYGDSIPNTDVLDTSSNSLGYPSVAFWSQPISPSITLKNAMYCDPQLKNSLDPKFRHILSYYYAAQISDPAETGFVSLLETYYGREIASENNYDTALDPYHFILRNDLVLWLPWKHGFDYSNTHPMPFYPEGHKTQDPIRLCDMMTRQGGYAYMDRPGLQMLEIPYEQQDFCLRVFLPDKMSEFQKTFDYAVYKASVAQLRDREVRLYIPKITLGNTNPAIGATLVNMGMASAFSPGEANFSAMVSGNQSSQLFLKYVIQQTMFAINEEGTLAAAITEAGGAGSGGNSIEESDIALFLADHPFMFMLVHKPTGCIMFMGSYQ